MHCGVRVYWAAVVALWASTAGKQEIGAVRCPHDLAWRVQPLAGGAARAGGRSSGVALYPIGAELVAAVAVIAVHDATKALDAKAAVARWPCVRRRPSSIRIREPQAANDIEPHLIEAHYLRVAGRAVHSGAVSEALNKAHAAGVEAPLASGHSAAKEHAPVGERLSVLRAGKKVDLLLHGDQIKALNRASECS